MKINFNLSAILGIGAALTSACSTGPVNQTRPNIIYIMSDDHAYQAISAYGSILKDLAPTPNIDRIARDGMRFDRCLVTNSISGPCRAVILTGKYSHLNGFITNEGQKPFDGTQQTFPKLLQKAGYTTAMIGKWHLESDPTGFDHWEILPGQGNYYNPDFITKDGRHREEGYVTELITDKCIEWLSEVKNCGKPFLLMMHHKAPHREWQPGPNEINLYKDVAFPEPVTLFDDYSGRGTAVNTQDMTISKTVPVLTG
jgi:arylsulfatase A-like enzyme